MGAGKSYLARSLTNSGPALLIAPHQSLVRTATARYRTHPSAQPVHCYLDSDDRWRRDHRLGITPDSLPKFRFTPRSPWTLVVDEVLSSTAALLSGGTILSKRAIRNFRALTRQVQQSKRSLLMDAGLDPEHVRQLVNLFRLDRAVYLHVEIPSTLTGPLWTTRDQTLYTAHLLDRTALLCHQGKRVVIYDTHLSFLRAIHRAFKEQGIGCGHVFGRGRGRDEEGASHEGLLEGRVPEGVQVVLLSPGGGTGLSLDAGPDGQSPFAAGFYGLRDVPGMGLPQALQGVGRARGRMPERYLLASRAPRGGDSPPSVTDEKNRLLKGAHDRQAAVVGATRRDRAEARLPPLDSHGLRLLDYDCYRTARRSILESDDWLPKASSALASMGLESRGDLAALQGNQPSESAPPVPIYATLRLEDAKEFLKAAREQERIQATREMLRAAPIDEAHARSTENQLERSPEDLRSLHRYRLQRLGGWSNAEIFDAADIDARDPADTVPGFIFHLAYTRLHYQGGKRDYGRGAIRALIANADLGDPSWSRCLEDDRRELGWREEAGRRVHSNLDRVLPNRLRARTPKEVIRRSLLNLLLPSGEGDVPLWRMLFRGAQLTFRSRGCPLSQALERGLVQVAARVAGVAGDGGNADASGWELLAGLTGHSWLIRPRASTTWR